MIKRVAVVLPAYNEAAGLETLIWRIVRALGHLDYRIVVVDDGSSDATAEIAADLSRELPLRLIRHARNSGYGAAIRTGLLAARHEAEVVVTMDADDSHDPSLIPLMLHGIACGSDVIVASRFVPGGKEVGVPLHRRALSHGAAFVFGHLLDIDDVNDYTSGYRAYRSEFVDELISVFGEAGLVRETGFTVGVELLLKADRAGGRLAEVPLVLRYDRKRSESKLDIRRTMGDYGRLLSRVKDEEALEEEPSDGRTRPHFGVGDGLLPTLVSDVLAVLVSFAISYVAYAWIIRAGLIDRGYPELTRYALLAGLYALTTIFSLWRFGLYVPRLSVLHLRHLQIVVEALTASVLIFFAVLFFASGSHPSRLLVLGAMALSFPIVLLSRRLVTGWLQQRRLERGRVGRALIYGAGWTGRLLMKKIKEAPRLGTEVVGFLDDTKAIGSQVWYRRSQMESTDVSVSVLGSGGDLAKAATETGATELYLAVPDITDSRIASIQAEAEALGLDFGIVPRMGAVRVDQLRVEEVGAIPVLRLHQARPHPVYNLTKRVLDLFLLAILSPAVVPVALLTALAIRIEGRPVLFKQTRIGLNGRPFTLFKFRTMRPDVDPYSASPSSEDDPRITRVGRIVRLAGLDELPQLINVLRGEMSLVGPRPEMPHIVADYGELERQRLCVRPGISGLWQLSPDRSQAIHDNLEYDLYYLRQRKLSFDLLILGETALFVARASVQSIRKLAGLGFRERAGSRRGSPEAWPRAPNGRQDPAESIVLVALDQRKRPDEPPSWRRFMPIVSTLGEECHVRVLVADRNSRRVRDLVESAGDGSGRLEYVPYLDGTDVKVLADDAHVVVTDVPHLASLAATGGGAVLIIHGEQIHTASAPAPRASLAAQVRSKLIGPDDGLRMAH